MQIKFRFRYNPGAELGWCIEESSTGKFYDFIDGVFADNSQHFVAKLIERWKDRHDGVPDPDEPGLKFLRGIYAPTIIPHQCPEIPSPNEPMQLDSPLIVQGETYFVYVLDLGEGGTVLASNTIDESAGSPIVINIPESLDVTGHLDIGALLSASQLAKPGVLAALVPALLPPPKPPEAPPAPEEAPAAPAPVAAKQRRTRK